MRDPRDTIIESSKTIEAIQTGTNRWTLRAIGSTGGSGGTSNQNQRSVSVTFDGGGSAITVGSQADVRIPYSGTITAWYIVGVGTAHSITVDVWKDTYANWPPTVADTIAGTEKPSFTAFSSGKNQDLTLSTWTTSVTAGDWLRFNVDACSATTRCTISIQIEASA